MPLRQIPAMEADTTYPEFVEALARELQPQTESGLPNAPLMIEEELPQQWLRVTVYWDAWKDLSPRERNRVILKAYEHVFGKARMLQISLAIGLTHREAIRLGIDVPE